MNLLPDIILANIFLILIWVTYELFLSKNRNFQANRFFLLGGSVLAVILPWLPWQLHFSILADSIFGISLIPMAEVVITPSSASGAALATSVPDPVNWPALIYFLIVSILVMASVVQLLRLLILAKTRPVVKWNNLRIIVLDKSWSAFSIFRTVFYPEPFDPEIKETRIILDHEQVHIRQLHSIDNLILLIIRILFFYNPVIYCIVARLRLTHEFIADEAASICNKTEYSHTLISHQFMVPRLILMQSFNNKSFLKRRLIMLSKNKHNRLAGWKYLLVLPLIGGMVMLSGWTASAQNQDTGKKAQVKKEVAQKLQEMGFVKTGEGTWTKEGITMKLSEGSPKITKTKDSDAKNAKEGEIPYQELDIKPQFPGGDAGLSKWLIETTKYPAEAVEKKISGIVYIQYVISKTGELENVKVLRGIDPLLDAEALRVINSSPKWTPGVKDGQPVRVTQQLPINFTLSKDGAKK